MKIRYMILAAALLISSGANAQQVAIGARGGLTIPSISGGGTNTPMSDGYKSQAAWGAGAFAEIKFTKTFSLQIGFEYSRQGGKKNGNQAIPSKDMIEGMAGDVSGGLVDLATTLATGGNVAGATQIGAFGSALEGALGAVQGSAPKYLYSDFNATSTFNYLMVPVQAKFGWNFRKDSPWRVYVSGGLFGAYMVSAERVSKASGTIYMDPTKTTSLRSALSPSVDPIADIMVTDVAARAALRSFLDKVYDGTIPANTQDLIKDVRRGNFGFIANVGVSYTFDRNTIFIEGGGQYGFVKLQKSKEHGQNRIGAGAVMVGYSYTLGRGK